MSKFSDHSWSWVAGALLVPVAGAVATRLVGSVLKPESLPQLGMLIAGMHGAVGLFAYAKSEDPNVSPRWQSFAQGGAISEGVVAAFGLWSGYKLASPAAQARIQQGGALGPPTGNAPALPSSTAIPSRELLEWLAGQPSLAA